MEAESPRGSFSGPFISPVISERRDIKPLYVFNLRLGRMPELKIAEAIVRAIISPDEARYKVGDVFLAGADVMGQGIAIKVMLSDKPVPMGSPS